MRILFSVQRYGEEIAGGAEQHCRWLAESLAARGHTAHVLTSTAVDYMTWSNFHEAGDSTLNGVHIHRFPAEKERDISWFNRLAESMDFKNHTTPITLEDLWLREQGPSLVGARTWLRHHLREFDVVVPFTYLYATSQIVVSEATSHIPIVMHATAHDEFPLYLRRISDELSAVDEFLCSTPEEESLLQARLSGAATTHVVGIGVSLDTVGDRDAALSNLGVPLDPYFVVLGRIDPSKGTDLAARMFSSWRLSTNRNVNLLAVGGKSSEFENLDLGEGVIQTGFVDEPTKSTLLHGAVGLIQPSPYESFSLALCESWLAGRPTVSTSASDVLVGQTQRTGGGLVYSSETEFGSCLDSLLNDPEAADRMGDSGRSYVETHFQPQVVVSRIETILESAIERHRTVA
jgi:glycosyltransferase involved in cell wall biosynthesis